MDPIDPYVGAPAICEMLGGKSRRCLYNMTHDGRFPRPDRPAQRRGEADLWRMSTVRKGLEDYAKATPAAPRRAAERDGPPISGAKLAAAEST